MSRNFYRQFLEMLPPRSLQVATVTAVSDGACTVELPGGGILQARGEALLGDTVFVRDGVIEAKTQTALTLVTIEV